MSDSIKALLVFVFICSMVFLVYWLGGGNFERGATLGYTTAIAVIWAGYVALMYKELK